MQDKNIAISELKKLIEKCKGKSVETQFDKPSVVRKLNAQRIPKPSVLGKPTPFSNSPEIRSFQTKQSVNKTNESDGVNHSTSVSRPPLKSYQVKDKVVPNNSQVKFTKKEVEDHHRISSISKKTKSVTAYNDSSNSRTSNVNAVCAECGKCVFNSNHDACVSKYLNDVNARTKKPKVVPISASKPKRKTNKSVATPHKKTVASDTTIQKPKSYFKELYENTNKAWKWWIEKKCPSEYKWTQTTPSRPSLKWKPTGRIFSNVRLRWIPIGKLLNSCTGKVESEPTHGSNVDIPHIHACKQTLGLSAASLTQAWLWHRRLSHLNFDYITLLSKKDVVTGLPKLKYVKDQLCSSCEMSKAKRSSFKSKLFQFSQKGRLNLLHMDLCGPMRVASINGKKYILVVVDDYSRYTWTLFLRSKDETPKPYSNEEGIEHQTSTPRTPEQNGVVERRNRTLVKAARTMLLASKLPLSFWAEAVATACYTQKINHHIDSWKDSKNGDPSVPWWEYSTQSKGYRVYNKRTRLIVESIHIKFDEIKEMMSDHNSSDLAPQRQEMSVENASLQARSQDKVGQIITTLPRPPRHNLFLQQKNRFTQQGWNFSSVLYLKNITIQTHGQAEENNNDQAPKPHFQEDDFLSSFFIHDHPLEQVHGNPTMPVQIRRQLATDPEMCMFALTVSIVEPKNIKEAMADSAWIEAMQDELHQFDRLKVSELVDKPFGKMVIKLKCWMSKKQNCTTISSVEAEYVALSASCAQVKWMRTQLKDYGFNYNKIPLYLRLISSAIAKSCNPYNIREQAPQRQMVSDENNTSGPVPQCSNDVCSHQFRPRSSSNDF
ncbi:retrovirus-related pol polyprotein from transposon TNT 1-94 [Tanacetum coccineum]|uniref:Retrovirus-related pol polyprotein from transposon TNT 1-94 n=1 Tax=Tanacetum coccineum TaxID=301880 RepID=A0ABQ5HZ37_9ASTR